MASLFLAVVFSLLSHSGQGLREQFSLGQEARNSCSQELDTLQLVLALSCERHSTNPKSCHAEASGTVQHASQYYWHNSLVSSQIRAKTPIFWAGFSGQDRSGIASRKDLKSFVKLKAGLELADSEWGQLAEVANDLASCPWDLARGFWQSASLAMARAMYDSRQNSILLAVHKGLEGKSSIYDTVLYQAELQSIGNEMQKRKDWNPVFKVYELPVGNSAGCSVAPILLQLLEAHAKRPVTMRCRSCPGGLRACGPQTHVAAGSLSEQCIGNCRDGYGKKTWSDGKSWEGDWKHGEEHGRGVEVLPSGDRFKGEWKNGQRNGRGTEDHANGDHYDGEWKHGARDGQGMYRWADGKRYEGGWKQNQMDGQGTYVWPDGGRYQGHWKQDRREGQGTQVYANGNRYEGGWKSHVWDGQGVWTWTNGVRARCRFRLGVQISCTRL